MSNRSRCQIYIVDRVWRSCACLGVLQVCLELLSVSPCSCSAVTSYCAVMTGTHRLARLWLGVWLLQGSKCRVFKERQKLCHFLTFCDSRTWSLSEETPSWRCCDGFVCWGGICAVGVQSPRPSRVLSAVFSLSTGLRSCCQLRVPVRWRGQATAAVVTESTKPHIQPQER